MKHQLNAEEREILERFERGELTAASEAQREMETAQLAARNTFNKTRRVNLRVTERDFNLAHARAREEGDPVPDVVVERHSQVPFRTADREQVTSVPSCRIGSRKSAARHRRRYNQPFLQHEPTGNHSRHRATGYIGGRLAPRPLEEGYRVRVLAPQRGTGALTFFFRLI